MNLKKRIVVFLLFSVLMWAGWNFLMLSVEPVISTDVALMQFDNTTEGHVVSRSYLTGIKPFLYSYQFPFLLNAAGFVVCFWPCFSSKNENEKEKGE